MGYLSGNVPAAAALVFGIAFLATNWIMPYVIRKLSAAGLVGGDMHKKGCPAVPNLGGMGIIVGYIAGVLAAVGLYTFFGLNMGLTRVLIGFITVLIMALIGIFDDLFEMRQWVKAVLPIFAAFPLMAIQAGDTTMMIPLLGPVDFGIWYIVILIPLGVTVASNLTNMLAGFNGLESGTGAIMTGAVALIALTQLGVYNGATDALILSAAMCGALLAFTRFNWFPAKVFPGDVGTLIIGGSVASAVMLGNMEAAGAILVIPHVIDFFIKLRHRFPKTFGKPEKNGKIYCPQIEARGLGQLVMKMTGGILEERLVLLLLLFELLFALVAIKLFAVI